MATGLNALDAELFELENIVVLVLQLVQQHRVVLDVPSFLLLRLFDLVVVALLQDQEELCIDLEVVLRDLDVVLSLKVLVDQDLELITKCSDL